MILQTTDPFYLKESFGQPMSFRNLSNTARAAKLRVHFAYEANRLQEGLHTSSLSLRSMVENLQVSKIDTSFIHRRTLWSEWYANYFPVVLEDNADHLRASHSITVESTREEIAGGPRPWSPEVREKQRALFNGL